MTKKVQEKKESSGKGWKRFKRRLSFLIFLVAAGTVFVRGYIPLNIPEGYTALIYTKWNQYDDELVDSSKKFIWRWERVIPTFLTLHLIPLDVHDTEISMSGELPSGDILLEHADLKGDFSYNLNLFVSYRIKADFIAELVKTQQLNLDELDDYYLQQDNRILQWYMNQSLKEQSNHGNSLFEPLLSINDLKKEFPQLEVFQINPTFQKIPDITLYKELRQQYFDFLNYKNQALSEAAVEIADLEQDTSFRLSILEQYGKLISEYPLLLDFFSIDSENKLQRYQGSDLLPVP